MQTPWLKITPVISTLYFTFATIASITTNANAGQTYGTPSGTLTLTTPDSATELWPGDPKRHYVMRADQSYTGTSTQSYAGGKFDPHGQVGIFRFFQTRGTPPGTPTIPVSYALTSMLQLSVSTHDQPANSPFTKPHSTSTWGPYTPDLSTYTPSGNPATDLYGVETVQLVFIDPTTTPVTQILLDYQEIDVYYPLVNPVTRQNYNTANFVVQNPQTQSLLAATPAPSPPYPPYLNTNTAQSYLGDPPRLGLKTSQTIYPGANFYVVIYPGAAQTTPPANAKTISPTAPGNPPGCWTAPTGDNGIYPYYVLADTPQTLLMDVGNWVTGSGIYTLQAMQQSSTNSFGTGTLPGTETFGNASSFSIKASYNVSSQLGLVK